MFDSEDDPQPPAPPSTTNPSSSSSSKIIPGGSRSRRKSNSKSVNYNSQETENDDDLMNSDEENELKATKMKKVVVKKAGGEGSVKKVKNTSSSSSSSSSTVSKYAPPKSTSPIPKKLANYKGQDVDFDDDETYLSNTYVNPPSSSQKPSRFWYTEQTYGHPLPIRDRYKFIPEKEDDGSPRIDKIIGRRPLDRGVRDKIKAAESQVNTTGMSRKEKREALLKVQRSVAITASNSTVGKNGSRVKDNSYHSTRVEYEFLVKHKNISYLHCKWYNAGDLASLSKNAKSMLGRYLKKIDGGIDDRGELEDWNIDSSFTDVEKVIDVKLVEEEVELSEKEIVMWEKREAEKKAERGDSYEPDDSDSDSDSDEPPDTDIQKELRIRIHRSDLRYCQNSKGKYKDPFTDFMHDGTRQSALRKKLQDIDPYFVHIKDSVNPYADGFIKDAPKKGRMAHLIFQRLNQRERMDANPGVTSADVTRMMAEEWNMMDDDAKTPYLLLQEDEAKVQAYHVLMHEKSVTMTSVWQPLRRCMKVLDHLQLDTFSLIFLEPVDLDSFTDYLDFVSDPMDLGSVRDKFDNKSYRDPTEFSRDCRKIWLNCKVYNQHGSAIWHVADYMSKLFERLFQAWVLDFKDDHVAKWTTFDARPWEETCRMCDGKCKAKDKALIVCDHCDANYNLKCLIPALVTIPDGIWHCPRCRLMDTERLASGTAEQMCRRRANMGDIPKKVIRKNMFLIKWTGLSYSECTWETRDDVGNDDKIRAFEGALSELPEEPMLTQADVSKAIETLDNTIEAIDFSKVKTNDDDVKLEIYSQARSLQFLKNKLPIPTKLAVYTGVTPISTPKKGLGFSRQIHSVETEIKSLVSDMVNMISRNPEAGHKNMTPPGIPHFAGEYDILIPLTYEGLMIAISDCSSSFVKTKVDDKYDGICHIIKLRRFTNGRIGYPESSGLMEKDDMIIGINGVSMIKETFMDDNGPVKTIQKSKLSGATGVWVRMLRKRHYGMDLDYTSMGRKGRELAEASLANFSMQRKHILYENALSLSRAEEEEEEEVVKENQKEEQIEEEEEEEAADSEDEAELDGESDSDGGNESDQSYGSEGDDPLDGASPFPSLSPSPGKRQRKRSKIKSNGNNGNANGDGDASMKTTHTGHTDMVIVPNDLEMDTHLINEDINGDAGIITPAQFAELQALKLSEQPTSRFTAMRFTGIDVGDSSDEDGGDESAVFFIDGVEVGVEDGVGKLTIIDEASASASSSDPFAPQLLSSSTKTNTHQKTKTTGDNDDGDVKMEVGNDADADVKAEAEAKAKALVKDKAKAKLDASQAPLPVIKSEFSNLPDIPKYIHAMMFTDKVPNDADFVNFPASSKNKSSKELTIDKAEEEKQKQLQADTLAEDEEEEEEEMILEGNSKRNFKIVQCDKRTGKAIHTWATIAQAALSLSIPAIRIKRVLKGEWDGDEGAEDEGGDQAGGFRWRYAASNAVVSMIPKVNNANGNKVEDYWHKLYDHDHQHPYKNEHTLRDYQVDGLNWMAKCWYERQGCILADEMGLGKTVQIVTYLEHLVRVEKASGPFLIVVPLSTIEHWRREFLGWTDLKYVVYHDTKREWRDVMREYEWYYPEKPRTADFLKFDVVVTTYDTLIADFEIFQSIPFMGTVVDEAHRLRNQKGKLLECMETMAKLGTAMHGFQHRILMTGTPLQNNMDELWTLLNFIDKRVFGDKKAFDRDFGFGNLTDQASVEKLQNMISPFMLRRVKEDVAKDIPEKNETLIDVELTPMQKQYYRAIFEKNQAFLAMGSGKAAPKLMNIQMELRKCCNHPFLLEGVEDRHYINEGNVHDLLEKTEKGVAVDIDGINSKVTELGLIKTSGKMVLLDKLLPKLRREGHKVLIFSQMVKMLDVIAEYCTFRDFNHERLDGRVTGNERQKAIDRFNSEEDSFLFLLSTRAGGVGINLTAADICIIFDSDWNPQNDVQAQARCHRIGQTKDVMIFRLITAHTFEQEMFDRASKKLGLEHAVLGSFQAEEDEKISAKEMEELLKKGAYALMTEEGDHRAMEEFEAEDIESILQKRTRTRVIEGARTSSWLNKSGHGVTRKGFTGQVDGTAPAVDLNDPNFWQKIMPDFITPTIMQAKLKKFIKDFDSASSARKKQQLKAKEEGGDGMDEVEEESETDVVEKKKVGSEGEEGGEGEGDVDMAASEGGETSSQIAALGDSGKKATVPVPEETDGDDDDDDDEEVKAVDPKGKFVRDDEVVTISNTFMQELGKVMDEIFEQIDAESVPKDNKEIVSSILLNITFRPKLFSVMQRDVAQMLLSRLEGDRRRRCRDESSRGDDDDDLTASQIIRKHAGGSSKKKRSGRGPSVGSDGYLHHEDSGEEDEWGNEDDIPRLMTKKEAVSIGGWTSTFKKISDSSKPWPNLPRESSGRILETLMNYILNMDRKVGGWFTLPIDEATFPDYYEMIEKPLSYSQMLETCKSGGYRSAPSMQKDLKCIMENTIKYNSTDSKIVAEARRQYLELPKMLEQACLFHDVFLQKDGTFRDVVSDDDDKFLTDGDSDSGDDADDKLMMQGVNKSRKRKERSEAGGGSDKKGPGYSSGSRSGSGPASGGRRVRCKKCTACNAKDCGKCGACADKLKFGGQGRKKQICAKKRCTNMQRSTSDDDDDDDDDSNENSKDNGKKSSSGITKKSHKKATSPKTLKAPKMPKPPKPAPVPKENPFELLPANHKEIYGYVPPPVFDLIAIVDAHEKLPVHKNLTISAAIVYTASFGKWQLPPRRFENQEASITKILKLTADKMIDQDKFNLFVDPISDDVAPNYSTTILDSIEMGTIRKKIIAHGYVFDEDGLDACYKDMCRVFSNCEDYNELECDMCYEAARICSFLPECFASASLSIWGGNMDNVKVKEFNPRNPATLDKLIEINRFGRLVTGDSMHNYVGVVVEIRKGWCSVLSYEPGLKKLFVSSQRPGKLSIVA